MSIESIVSKLRESRVRESNEGYEVIDKSDVDHPHYYCPDLESAEQRKAELIADGADEDKVIIQEKNPKKEESLEEAEDDTAYEEFKKACMSNPTWKKANAICEKYGYKLSPTSCVDVYASGRKMPSVNIMRDRAKDYNPDIYFYAAKFGKTDPTLEIQTTSYGSLTLEQHAEFLESVTNAHKMVEELSEIDFTTLHEYEIDKANESKQIDEAIDIKVGTTFENAGYEWEVLALRGEYALLYSADRKYHPYAVVWKIDSDGSWAQGHYFSTENEASRYLKSK